MKQKRKCIFAVCGCLLAVTVALGLWFRSAQKDVEGIELTFGGKTLAVSYEELNQIAFSGELVNGKGERTVHEYRGVELSQLLKTHDIEMVSFVEVTSADHYSVSLGGDEVWETGKVYLAVKIDGQAVEGIDNGTKGAQLIVFGDPDSKRCVRYTKYINVSE